MRNPHEQTRRETPVAPFCRVCDNPEARLNRQKQGLVSAQAVEFSEGCKMQPFAQKDNAPLNLHWWITAGVAGAFFLWCFDLVPRFGAPESGKVANQPADETDGAAENDWSSFELTDAGASDPEDASVEARHEKDNAWLGLNEPVAPTVDSDATTRTAEAPARRTSNKGKKRMADPAIAQASYETAPEDSIQNAGLTEVADENRSLKSSVQSKLSSEKTPILPADFAEQLRDAESLMADSNILEAHAKLSQLYWKFPEFRPRLLPSLEQTSTAIFTSSEQLFGEPHFVEYGETLESIGKQYEVPWQYLALLNRVTPEKLQAGQKLKVVRGPFGAVVDLKSYTLTVHAHGWYVRHYQVGIGKDGKTPVGVFTVKEKLENPEWYDPDGGVVDADDPDNPLGEYWLGLGDHIGIHGTIDPDSIGRAASRGCVHLGDKDIEEVFSLLSVGSQVKIRQ